MLRESPNQISNNSKVDDRSPPQCIDSKVRPEDILKSSLAENDNLSSSNLPRHYSAKILEALGVS